MAYQMLVAVVLGIVEGITEFLPVSSTGHLIVAGHALNFTGLRADTFEIFIQSGAILAVVVLYFSRFTGLLKFSKNGPGTAGFEGWAGISKIIVGCIPAFVLGALLHKVIKNHLFSPLTVAVGFAVGGVLILLVEWRYRDPKVGTVEQLSLWQCFGIGCVQCLGLWPGMSRSGSTIIGAMALGCSRTVAAEFSFLLAVPVLVGAVSLDMYKSFSLLQPGDLLFFGVGFVVSFVAALGSIKALITFLGHHSLSGFAYYRIIFGVLLLGAWFSQILPAGMYQP
jgi:undecaprenyl-diphosphatase